VGAAIGFIGIGNMGLPMASRLQAAGYRLVVHDKRPETTAPLTARGATAVSTPADAAAQAETVLMSLPTPEVVEAVALGPQGLAAGKTVKRVVDLSTTGPRMAKKVGAALAQKGIAFIDAPVSGGPGGARAGTLAVMAACAREDFDALETALKVIGKPFHVGTEPGMGQVMKLVNNLLSGTALAISSEALVLGVKAGLDPEIMVEVINAGSGRNSATQDKFPRAILPRKFDYGFTTGLMVKDLKLFLEEAESLGLSLKTAQAVSALWLKALEEEGSDSDFTTIVKVVERPANVEVRGKSLKGARRG
jgi:hypothetical protein